MTKEMLVDIIEKLRKKITILIVVCVILAIISAIFIALFFVEFEITTELIVDEEVEVELEQDNGDGSGDNIAIINSEVNEQGTDEKCDVSKLLIFSGIGCLTIIFTGVIIAINGKAKNNHTQEKNED